MSRVTIVGAGKLGFPVGCVMQDRGHNVMFYDKNVTTLDRWKAGQLPKEKGLQEVYDRIGMTLHYSANIDRAMMGAEIIFVAVQTPHAPEQDGSTRFNHVRADFDLSFVKSAVTEITDYLAANPQPHAPRTVVIISTMLPGSMDNEIAPLFAPAAANNDVLLYSPSFIAMGTVVKDFQNPEFWLVGGAPTAALTAFYRTISRAPLALMSYASAEATKVLYNTWITMKITLANLAMEIAAGVPGCNATDISSTLACADKRLTNSAYMRPGMVDGGSCHPRDNIAMSWLSDKLGLKYNLFDTMMDIREKQVEFLADQVIAQAAGIMPIVLSSRAFKAGTDVVAGSPALLLQEILAEKGYTSKFLDEVEDDRVKCVVLTTCEIPEGVKVTDFIIDPWGIAGEWPHATLVGR